MREIKFRYRISYSGDIRTHIFTLRDIETHLGLCNSSLKDANIKILSREQYTTLPDKTGKEICEGDKLRDKDSSLGTFERDYPKRGIGIVEWSNRRCAFVLKWWDSRDYACTPLLTDMVGRYNEIVGNIHEEQCK